jgi:hypothetical protein
LLQHIDFTGLYDDGLDALVKRLTEFRATVLPHESEASQQSEQLAGNAHTYSSGPSATERELLARYNEAREAGDDFERQYELYQQIAAMDEDFNREYIQQRLRQLPGQIRNQQRARLLAKAHSAESVDNWRTSVGVWQSLVAMEPKNQEFRGELVRALRKAAESASDAALWLEEIDMLNALLDLVPDDPQAKYHLKIAKQNQESYLLYENARDLAQAGRNEFAKQDLALLKQRAPDYSDPASIAIRVGAEPLMTFARIEERRLQEENERRLREERLRQEEERRLQEENERRLREQEEKRKADEAMRLSDAKARSEAMQPRIMLVPIASVTPKARGILIHRRMVLSDTPQLAIPRKALLVGEPFIARVSFALRRKVILNQITLEIVFREVSRRKVEETAYRYNPETKERESYTLWRYVPVNKDRTISRVNWHGENFNTTDVIAREAEMRIPVTAMHSFADGAAYKLDWLFILRIAVDSDELYEYIYDFQVIPKVYR